MLELGDRIGQNPWVRKTIDVHESMNCCCLLFSSNQGFKLIFLGLCIMAAEEYWAFNQIRVMLKVAMLVPFVMTFVVDCSFHRMLCLYLFGLCMPLIAICNLFMYGNILVSNVLFADQICWLSKKWTKEMGGDKEQNEAQEECNEADEEDQADCEANLDQCPVLPGGAAKVLLVITPLVLLVNLHFMYVLYTHYKRASLPKRQGGCYDDDW